MTSESGPTRAPLEPRLHGEKHRISDLKATGARDSFRLGADIYEMSQKCAPRD